MERQGKKENNREFDKRKKLSQKNRDNWDKIDIKTSNEHLTGKEHENIRDWTHRARTMSVYTGARGFELGRIEGKKHKASIFFELGFTSPECDECGDVEDYWHLWTCGKLADVRTKAGKQRSTRAKS